MKNCLAYLIALIPCCCFCQHLEKHEDHESHHVYKWDNKRDGIITGTAAFTWLASQYLKSRSDKITPEDLPMRDPENIWFIDKGATDNYSANADKWSDVILYTSFALPFTHYSGQLCRDQGFVIASMALQTFFINDGITNISKALTKRFRPFTYNPDVPDEEKLTNGARYSFMSGHASNSAALGWFTAKVYSDLYPNSKWKPVVWTLGVGLPAATSYLRHKAGKHFPTDVIAGYMLGAAIGYLVPHFHKIKSDDMSLQLIPNQNGAMLSFTKRLK